MQAVVLHCGFVTHTTTLFGVWWLLLCCLPAGAGPAGQYYQWHTWAPGAPHV